MIFVCCAIKGCPKCVNKGVHVKNTAFRVCFIRGYDLSTTTQVMTNQPHITTDVCIKTDTLASDSRCLDHRQSLARAATTWFTSKLWSAELSLRHRVIVIQEDLGVYSQITRVAYTVIFKSPQSGPTLCFQFVSAAAAASAAATTFASHVKTVWAKP